MAADITRAQPARTPRTTEETLPLHRLRDGVHVARQIVARHGERFRRPLDLLEAELSARLAATPEKTAAIGE
jgi:hypothetical protein